MPDVTLFKVTAVSSVPIYSALSVGAAYWPADSGPNSFAMHATQGDLGASFSTPLFPGPFGAEGILLSFDARIDFMQVRGVNGANDGITLWAFNSSRQLLGRCEASLSFASPGCAATFFGGDTPYNTANGNGPWVLSFSDGVPDIAYVLIGMTGGGGDDVGQLTFNVVTEPATLSLLCLGLVGIGLLRRRKVA